MPNSIEKAVAECTLCTSKCGRSESPQLVHKFSDVCENGEQGEQSDVLFLIEKPTGDLSAELKACREIAGSGNFSLAYSQRCQTVDDDLAAYRCSVYNRILYKMYRYFVIDEQASKSLNLPFSDGKVKTMPFGVVLFVKDVLESKTRKQNAKLFEQLISIPNRKVLLKLS